MVQSGLALVLLAVSSTAGATAVAQRPDFSGEWVRVDSAAAPTVAATGDAAFRRGEMGSGWGSPLTITQQADRLVVMFPSSRRMTCSPAFATYLRSTDPNHATTS